MAFVFTIQENVLNCWKSVCLEIILGTDKDIVYTLKHPEGRQ